MLVLDRPELDDLKVLKRLGADPRFTASSGVWTKAYADYEAAGGDPWTVSPAVFVDDIADAQRALYDARRNSRALRRIRRREDFRCCPMCGSGGRGHLDHMLPRAAYPEFSILGLNLVPTCPSCNSNNKRETYRGDPPERFLHPYFDTIAADPIWFVDIVGDLKAAVLVPTVMPGLDDDDASRVAFHLANVLGWDFEVWAINYWAGLPQLVRDARDLAVWISGTEARESVELLYRQACGGEGRNSWTAALLRGVLQRPDACDRIAAEAILRVPTAI